jgi:hypothetical protein
MSDLSPLCAQDRTSLTFYRSRASLRRPQWWSLRSGLKTRSTLRFKAGMTPIRANIVGPPSVATSISASIAACHSGVNS